VPPLAEIDSESLRLRPTHVSRRGDQRGGSVCYGLLGHRKATGVIGSGRVTPTAREVRPVWFVSTQYREVGRVQAAVIKSASGYQRDQKGALTKHTWNWRCVMVWQHPDVDVLPDSIQIRSLRHVIHEMRTVSTGMVVVQSFSQVTPMASLDLPINEDKR
jgi:hypothetical protein